MVEEPSTKAEKLGKNVATAAFGIAGKVADFIGSVIDTSASNVFGNCVTEEEQRKQAAAGRYEPGTAGYQRPDHREEAPRKTK